MVTVNQTMVACLVRATALTALVAVHSAALHTAAFAQVPSSPLFVAPEYTPVAAVAAPASSPSASGLVKPAALPPAAPSVATSPIPCTATAEYSHLDRPLVHTMSRLAGGEPLTIVAIGSSSTAGAGASSPAASYPSRLAVELNARFPGHDIAVLNRGVNGDETNNMMARFPTGVIAEHPQLVLWQVGTNSVLRDHPLKPHGEVLHEGVEELKAIGADVVMIDPQYAPKVLAKPETPGMVEQIALTAKEENVDLFQRFAVMRNWHEVGRLPFDTFVSPDGLHMNDWGYACWAKLLGAAIAEAVNRPVASAAVHAAPASSR